MRRATDFALFLLLFLILFILTFIGFIVTLAKPIYSLIQPYLHGGTKYVGETHAAKYLDYIAFTYIPISAILSLIVCLTIRSMIKNRKQKH